MKTIMSLKRRKAGFTLIELLVVVLIIGILAAIAVPQYFKVVEKGKFSEAMHWLGGVKSAQERFLARDGRYFTGAATGTGFDVTLGATRYFSAGAITATTANPPTWTISILRGGGTNCPGAYGCYSLTYSAPPGSLSCSNPSCTSDLLPQ